jgi:anti-sigma regulatory factor (Ser/Thr protein kinase)
MATQGLGVALAHRMTLRFDTDTRTLRVMRRLVRDLVRTQGGSDEDAFALETAVGEVLINAFEHAYARALGPLELDVLYDETKIDLTIHDDGEPITDAPAIPRRPPTGTRGWGLYLVGQLTDEAEVIHPWRDPRGTGVRLAKYLRPRRPAPDPRADE